MAIVLGVPNFRIFTVLFAFPAFLNVGSNVNFFSSSKKQMSAV